MKKQKLFLQYESGVGEGRVHFEKTKAVKMNGYGLCWTLIRFFTRIVGAVEDYPVEGGCFRRRSSGPISIFNPIQILICSGLDR